MNDLTIIVPAFNEEKAIKDTLVNVLPIIDKFGWNLIVINDGSIDRTKQILSEITHPKLSIIEHKVNRGYGASLKTGIRNSSTAYIALYDADGQHNPEDLEKMYQHIIENDEDMLVGMRGKDSHQEWVRKPGKFILSKTANLLTGKKIPDLNSGLRIIRRDVIVDKLHLFSNAFSFSTTSTIALMNMDYKVDYFPIKVNKRIGTSSVRQFRHGFATILLIIRLIMLFNPLKVFLPSSAFFVFIGSIYEIIYGIILSEHLKLLPGALLAILTGIIIFFMGLVVDQIAEIRKSMKT
ncbi:MAG: glycosyltransferase family 2 protein [Candidatus Delongbacteria bacterium]|nr:glycosyltransferase family 2 protein [Candidatus Delongbacteria bacterium]